MNEALYTVNNLWILIATVLVFIMHLGFATLEAGFVQKKNTVNILFKNCMIIAIGLITYCLIGFNLMYPGGDGGGFIGFAGFGLSLPEGAAGGIEYADGAYHYYSDFIFQAMFAATCATIVSGAVAERIKLMPFLVFTILFVMISYPITGMWKWGAGWLDAMGFYDFAGSTIVHSVGGWGALAGIILLGARKGKYTKKGIKPIPGHSIPLATLGVFLLWFGWFGFNGGSVLSADPSSVGLVFVTTSLAAAAGAIGAFFVSYWMFKSHDLSMVLNGILGGLVGITAGADVVSVTSALVIGLIAGSIIPLSVVFFDRYLKLDDPVGATSVHLVCGIWGTLAVGIFGIGEFSFITQLIGVASIGLFTFIFAFGVFYVLKVTVGIRVTEEEEVKGLDLAEHDMPAYPEFESQSSPYELAIK
ncbi:ammonium transporter [Saprospiraceae bacterium]|jgi:Amt family ammonium transporter|nr:ammonium transporter [Bacteroidota bacterium]MDB4727175.1 ammonium transporter [Saprospiraceae bacterium]MDF1863411.1 ammonium transporter [Saprospiraceae bacterium]